MEDARRRELGLQQLVASGGIAAAYVHHVVRAHVMRVADAQRESTAVVRVVEERMPSRYAVDHDVLGSVEQGLHPSGFVWVEVVLLLRLSTLDHSLAGRVGRTLRKRRQGQHDNQECTPQYGVHESPSLGVRSPVHITFIAFRRVSARARFRVTFACLYRVRQHPEGFRMRKTLAIGPQAIDPWGQLRLDLFRISPRKRLRHREFIILLWTIAGQSAYTSRP